MILCGDALTELKNLDSGIVQTCITSPPYWGLRDYGVDGQLGLESTPEEYIARLVEIFAEVKRVLRDDGTLWLVLGDSYAAGKTGRSDYGREIGDRGGHLAHDEHIVRQRDVAPGLKPKDLCMIPARVAIALQSIATDCNGLQSHGWWLRSDIIWAKPNPMPESVTDRPTSAHEHIFLLAKSQRYFYDADAIREPLQDSTIIRYQTGWGGDQQRGYPGGEQNHFSKYMGSDRAQEASGRNKRNVWTVATKPYPEAHFAVYPPALIEPCVLAGSASQACEMCGAPWERVVEKTGRKVATPDMYGRPRTIELHGNGTASKFSEAHGAPSGFFSNETIPVGFQPTCSCDNEGTGQSIVLDPFMGSGTTGEVALKHRRQFIGIELNPEYVELAEKRLREVEVVMF